MSETIEESYNKLVDAHDALEKAIMELCDIDTQRKLIRRKKDLQSGKQKGDEEDMKNAEIIEIGKPGEVNLEGLEIHVLAYADGMFRGINIQETTKEGKTQRSVFISSVIEFEKLIVELTKLLEKIREEEAQK